MDKSGEGQYYRAHQDDQEAFSYAMWFVGLGILPMTLHATIKLEVFEIMGRAGSDAKLTSKEIATHLPTKNPDAAIMLERMLGVLASHGVVGCSTAAIDVRGKAERVYSLTPVSKYFVKDQDGISLRPFLDLLLEKDLIASWYYFKDAVLEGGDPFYRAHGMNIFEFTSKHKRYNQLFNTAMSNHSTMVMRGILELYHGFQKVKQLVDVGGGSGVNLRIITSKYPSIKGINFDLPHVIQYAPSYPGMEHIGGDMFESVPGGDAIFMKGILHNWGDDDCIKVLKNCDKVIPDDGKIIVVEAILSDVSETSIDEKATSIYDMIMMASHSGGKERTRQEYKTLAIKAGFSDVEFKCRVNSCWVMEFLK